MTNQGTALRGGAVKALVSRVAPSLLPDVLRQLCQNVSHSVLLDARLLQFLESKKSNFVRLFAKSEVNFS